MQHLKGAATDCIGLIVEVLKPYFKENGFAYPKYSPMARPGQLADYLNRYLEPIGEAPLPGDVGLFKWRVTPTHLAFFGDWKYGGLSMIHALAPPQARVLETPFGGEWPENLVGVWRVPGIV